MEFKEGIIWNTTTTQYDKNDDITYSTGTFNSVNNIEQLKGNCSEKVKEDRGEPTIKKFHGKIGQGEMIRWFRTNLKDKMTGKRGPIIKNLIHQIFMKVLLEKVYKYYLQMKLIKKKNGGLEKVRV